MELDHTFDDHSTTVCCARPRGRGKVMQAQLPMIEQRVMTVTNALQHRKTCLCLRSQRLACA